MNLRKLLREKTAQVVGVVSAGVLLIVLLILFIVLWPLKNKDKALATKTKADLAENTDFTQQGDVAKTPQRPLSSSNTTGVTEKEDKDKVSSSSAVNTKEQKGGLTGKSVPVQNQETNKNPPLQEPPKAEPEKQPETCEEWKAKFESLLLNFDSDVDASKGRSELDAALNKISEVCKEPLKDLVDYSRAVYEAKRDTCLGAIIASEKDMKLLEKMLMGVQVVDSSYKDTPLALQFVQQFVPAFVDPFTKLETDALPNPEFNNLAKEANKAFPIARIFAPLVPSKAPKDLADKCKHEAFRHPNLVAYLEDIIPKYIENANDAVSEALTLKYITILRALKPKSIYSFQGKDSFNEIKDSLQHPIRSFLETTDAIASEEFLKIEDIKDLTGDKLKELKIMKSTTAHMPDTIEHYICCSNHFLHRALLVDRSVWDEGIFKAWMNTGFNTLACPEFINWVEHDIERNGLESPNGKSVCNALGAHYSMKEDALWKLGSEDDAF